MVLRRELGRRGDVALIQSQFVGVSGQVCGTTYEIVGPEPGRFCDPVEARRVFERISSAHLREAA